MKTVSMFLALLLLASMCEARPPWYKDWKVWLVVGVSLGASAAATHESHECRVKFGPSPCQGGYGEFAAREGVRFGTAAFLAAHAVWGREHDVRPWPVFAVGFAAYNTSVAFRQSRIGCPAGQEFVYGTKYNCQKAD